MNAPFAIFRPLPRQTLAMLDPLSPSARIEAIDALLADLEPAVS